MTQQATELIAQQYANGSANKKVWSDIIYNVKAYGAIGNGSNDDTSSIIKAINDADDAGGIVFFNPGHYRITSNVTVPSNVTLWFAEGGILDIQSGTFTINGVIQAGFYQIFNTTGSGQVRGEPQNEFITCEWWGAKGDDNNDDTAALQKALNFVNFQSGGAIHLRAAIYKLTTAVEFQGNNMSLIGQGAGVSVLKQYGFNQGIINGSIDYLKLNSVISGISFICDTPKESSAIALLDAHNCRISNVSISNFKFGVSILDRCFDVYLNDFIIDNVYDGGAAIFVDVKPFGGGVFVYDGVVDCHHNFGTDCLRIHSMSGSFFSNLDLRAAGSVGINFSPPTGDVIIYNWFNNVLGDGPLADGWLFNAVAGSFIYGVFMDQCWSGTCGTAGITIKGAGTIDGIDIKGHIAIDNALDGVYIESGINISIQGGTFSGNSNGTPNTDNGIRVKPGVSKFKISGIRSGQSIGRTNSQARGILVETGASNNYMIVNNDLTNNMTSGITDNGTGLNKVVNNNLS